MAETQHNPHNLTALVRPWLRSEDEAAAFLGERVPPMGIAMTIYNRVLSRGESQDFRVQHHATRHDGVLVDRGWQITDGLTPTWAELWCGHGATPDAAMAALLEKALARVCPECGFANEPGWPEDHVNGCSRSAEEVA